MISKTILFVAIGIAVGVIAGIVIGLASYPVTMEEKAQGSSSMMMGDDQDMQSMDSKSDNQSMMISDDMPFNPKAPILIPLIDGYYNGNKVFFLHTEVSDETMADMMTMMINFPTLHVPALVNSTDGNVSKVYVFTNGVSGSEPYGGGPFMFQIDVFDSVPYQQGYSSFHVPHLVTWNENANPRVLTSVEQILQAEANGEVTIKKTENIVNAPIVAWQENGQNRTVSSIEMPYVSMPDFDADIIYLNTDQYAARLELEQKQ